MGGKSFIIENHPGVGGNIGIAQVVRLAPGSCSLLLVSSAFVINPSLYANAGLDPIKDFVPITLAVTSPNVIVTTPAFPAKELAEFIQVVKANPGKYDCASPGGGTGPHLSAELLKLRSQLSIQHVCLQRRRANGAGRAQQRARGVHARHSHGCRIGHCRFRRRDPATCDGARRHATGHRQQIAGRDNARWQTRG